MPPLLQFWLPIALAVALTAIAMYEKSRRAIQTGLYVLAAVVATAAMTWQIATSQVSRTETRTPILRGWGTTGPFCAAVVDGSRLIEFRDKYAVAIVCGVEDSTVDRLEDRRITVSPLFTIQSQLISIVVPHSKEMAKTLGKQTEEALKGVPRGMAVSVMAATWYDVVLLPKGVETSGGHVNMSVEFAEGDAPPSSR